MMSSQVTRACYYETISQNREAPIGFVFRPCVMVEKEIVETGIDGLRSPLVRFEDEMKRVLDLAIDEEEKEENEKENGNWTEKNVGESQNGIRMEEKGPEMEMEKQKRMEK